MLHQRYPLGRKCVDSIFSWGFKFQWRIQFSAEDSLKLNISWNVNVRVNSWLSEVLGDLVRFVVDQCWKLSILQWSLLLMYNTVALIIYAWVKFLWVRPSAATAWMAVSAAAIDGQGMTQVARWWIFGSKPRRLDGLTKSRRQYDTQHLLSHLSEDSGRSEI